VFSSAIDGGRLGLSAWVDGVIPFYDPLAEMGVYDSNDSTLQVSKLIGSFSRDIGLAIISGGAVGHAVRSEGITMSTGGRLIAAEFGPSWTTVITGIGKQLTNSALYADYAGKWYGRLDTFFNTIDFIYSPVPGKP